MSLTNNINSRDAYLLQAFEGHKKGNQSFSQQNWEAPESFTANSLSFDFDQMLEKSNQEDMYFENLKKLFDENFSQSLGLSQNNPRHDHLKEEILREALEIAKSKNPNPSYQDVLTEVSQVIERYDAANDGDAGDTDFDTAIQLKDVMADPVRTITGEALTILPPVNPSPIDNFPPLFPTTTNPIPPIDQNTLLQFLPIIIQTIIQSIIPLLTGQNIFPPQRPVFPPQRPILIDPNDVIFTRPSSTNDIPVINGGVQPSPLPIDIPVINGGVQPSPLPIDIPILLDGRQPATPLSNSLLFETTGASSLLTPQHSIVRDRFNRPIILNPNNGEAFTLDTNGMIIAKDTPLNYRNSKYSYQFERRFSNPLSEPLDYNIGFKSVEEIFNFLKQSPEDNHVHKFNVGNFIGSSLNAAGLDYFDIGDDIGNILSSTNDPNDSLRDNSLFTLAEFHDALKRVEELSTINIFGTL